MKQFCKTVLFTCLFCSSLLMRGQEETYHEFAPLGATWHYDHGIEVSRYIDTDIERAYLTLTSVKDTLIKGRTIRMVQERFTYSWINGQPLTTPSDSWLYFYQIRGKVYQTNKQGDWFSLVYDFSAQVGDTWILNSDLMGNHTEECWAFQVTAIDTLIIDGIPLKRQHVKAANDPLAPSACYFRGPFIERIGTATSYLKPVADNLIELGNPVRCYSDPLLDLFTK